MEDYSKTPDYEELPEYLVEHYQYRLQTARQKLDRLDKFATGEFKRSKKRRPAGEPVDWDRERDKRAKLLNRWVRETNGVVAAFTDLLDDLRQDQAIIREFILTMSGKNRG